MTVVSWYSDADTRVRRDVPNANYGTGTFVNVGMVNVSGVLYHQQAYFSFPISGIPANAVLTSATLSLTQYGSGSTESGTLRMYVLPCTSGWAEGTMTWNTGRPTSSWTGAVGHDYTGTTDGAKCDINVLPICQQWVNSGWANYGFYILFDENTSLDQLKYFYTKEVATQSYRPLLTIDYYIPSVNPPIRLNVGGTWKTATNTYVNIGGTWRTVTNAYTNVGGTWREILS